MLSTTIQQFRFLCMLCLFIASNYALHSQTSITGAVKDVGNNALHGVTIILSGTANASAITDKKGNYTLQLSEAGTYTIEASAVGFGSQTADVSLSVGESKTKDFTLSSEALALGEVIITTGTFGKRSQLNAPMSVTYMGSKQLERTTFNSQADILRNIPGITAEGGGGEVASNVFVRGMPSGGQYQFTPLQVDGIPVLSTFGLNSSAHDVYFRNDIGIQNLEFVRGGASTLFGAGSVAGIINYKSITGGPIVRNKVQLELASEGRAKIDFLASGPLAKNMYYAISGFYRYDEGPVSSGLKTRGYQVRGNIKKMFNNGKSSFTLYAQFINDNVQFFLPYPLTNPSAEGRDRPTGNDGKPIYTTLTGQATGFSFSTPYGQYQSRIGDGVSTKGGYLMAALDHSFGEGWKMNAKLKGASYNHWFNLFLDGDGTRNTPESQTDYLSNREITGTNHTFTYLDDSTTLGQNEFLFENRVLDRKRPMEELVGELNLSKSFGKHMVTVGTFMSYTKAGDANWIYNFLGDFRNAPRMVGLSYVNASGETVNYSPGGYIDSSGRQTSNHLIQSMKQAIYAAYAYQGERFNIDFGVRWEQASGNIRRETTLAGNAFQKGNVGTNGLAIALAFLYKAAKSTSIYVNASKGYFFPELRGVKFSNGTPQSYKPEDIYQGELGLKYGKGKFAGTIAAYFVFLDNRRSVDFVNNPSGGVTEQTFTQSTRTVGFEVNATYQPISWIDIYGNLTYQNGEFTKFEGSGTNLVGKQPRRQPQFMGRLGITLERWGFDLDLSNNFVGSKYANDANTVSLPGYSVMNASLGYSIKLEKGQSIRLGVSVFNLLNSVGITEGSPRQGNAQISGGQYFVGRPMLPRRIFFRVAFNF